MSRSQPPREDRLNMSIAAIIEIAMMPVVVANVLQLMEAAVGAS